MRHIKDIQIESIIVHITDPARKDNPHFQGLVLSERALPLVGNQELIDYFSKHIVNGLQDSAAVAAQFKSFSPDQTASVCKALLSQETDLVSGSQCIAQNLYRILEKDQRLSTGTLVVTFFKDVQNSQDLYLALLKIDPSKAFRPIIHTSNGTQYIGFEVESEVMPTTRERLQKCAFIRPLDPRPDEFDMMLLDRQAGTVAKFFSRDFLDVEIVNDDKTRTDKLYDAMIAANNILNKQLTPDQNDMLDEFIHQAIAFQFINVDSLLANLDLPDEYKEQIDKVISKKLPDREFRIDPTYAQSLIQKRRFVGGTHVGGTDLRVVVTADKYHNIIPESPSWVEDNGGYFKIIIHTKEWREVLR